MILVKVQKQRQLIKKIEISGHADSARYGEDLICAAVSAVVTGTLNAVEELVSGSCRIRQSIKQTVIAEATENQTLQIILETMLYQLKTVAESNPQYIRIEQEVVL